MTYIRRPDGFLTGPESSFAYRQIDARSVH